MARKKLLAADKNMQISMMQGTLNSKQIRGTLFSCPV